MVRTLSQSRLSRRTCRRRRSTMLALSVFCLIGCVPSSFFSAQSTSRPNVASLPQGCQARAGVTPRIAELLGILAEHPAAEGYNTLGVLFGQEDKFNCAIAAFDQALRLNAQAWDARYNLALTLAKKGEKSKAIDQLQILVK